MRNLSAFVRNGNGRYPETSGSSRSYRTVRSECHKLPSRHAVRVETTHVFVHNSLVGVVGKQLRIQSLYHLSLLTPVRHQDRRCSKSAPHCAPLSFGPCLPLSTTADASECKPLR